MSVSGTVQLWDCARGTGVLRCSDGYEAYVSAEALVGGERLRPGANVTFDIAASPARASDTRRPARALKRRVACNVTGVGVVPPAEGALEGVVVEWQPAFNFGKIVFSPAGDAGPETVFVHASAAGGQPLAVGHPVRFNLPPDAPRLSGLRVAVDVSGPAVQQLATHSLGTVTTWDHDAGTGTVTLQVPVTRAQLQGGWLVEGGKVYLDMAKDGAAGWVVRGASGPAVRASSMPYAPTPQEAEGGGGVHRETQTAAHADSACGPSDEASLDPSLELLLQRFRGE
eukprot:TRINITY_DN8218_c0_g1_i1.p1 TRINITY_DN8218_c0_g1~~TRINITY_DN8218_c0_g1_i1.p1  ORF type:complete len:323 (+),score=58.17 TRINITY_DN8218_c0_g1_i1:119-970(+)